jgi:adenylate cyclase
MGPQRRKVTLGRDLEADFVVRDRRCHARARHHRAPARALRAGRPQRQRHLRQHRRPPEMRVHHEELTLVGRGWLCFGRPRAEASTMLAFRCAGGADAG